MITAIVLVLLFCMLFIGTPVALALAIAGSLGLYMMGGAPMLLGILQTTPLSTASSYELITIPMFILMAEFVVLSGVADDLFDAAAAWIGRLRGGLAMATALAGAGFATPESVLHDTAADLYLVSNINGSPLEKDDNGFISRVSPEGQVVALKWIDGAAEGVTLNAPKGMAISGDTLYVADIDALRMFDRATGAPKGQIAVEGATFLNDLAVAPAGGVYLTDSGLQAGAAGFEPSGSAAVYHVHADGTVEALLKKLSAFETNNDFLSSLGAPARTSTWATIPGSRWKRKPGLAATTMSSCWSPTPPRPSEMPQPRRRPRKPCWRLAWPSRCRPIWRVG